MLLLFFYWQWIKVERKYKEELDLESKNTSKLEKSMTELIQFAEDEKLSADDKLEKIIPIAKYCLGYLGGMQHHFPKK